MAFSKRNVGLELYIWESNTRWWVFFYNQMVDSGNKCTRGKRAGQPSPNFQGATIEGEEGESAIQTENSPSFAAGGVIEARHEKVKVVEGVVSNTSCRRENLLMMKS